MLICKQNPCHCGIAFSGEEHLGSFLNESAGTMWERMGFLLEKWATLGGPAPQLNGITWWVWTTAPDMGPPSWSSPGMARVWVQRERRGEGLPRRPWALLFYVMHGDNHLPETDEETGKSQRGSVTCLMVTRPACDGIGFVRSPSTIQRLGCVFI